MCGITGILTPSSAAPALRDKLPAELERLAQDLSHRGPDASFRVIEGGVGLAHTRLAIIDLSPTGAQPMWSPERRLVMVYNGEVYNFARLREREHPGEAPERPLPLARQEPQHVFGVAGAGEPLAARLELAAAPLTLRHGIRQLMPGTFARLREGRAAALGRFAPEPGPAQPKLRGELSRPRGRALDGRARAPRRRRAGRSALRKRRLIDHRHALRTPRVPREDLLGGHRDPAYDERRATRALAKAIGSDHHAIELPDAPHSEELDRVVDHHSNRFADSSSLAVLRLSREMCRHSPRPRQLARVRRVATKSRPRQTMAFTTLFWPEVKGRLLRMSMAYSLEVRPPLLAAGVLDLAARMPFVPKHADGIGKRVALARRLVLPGEVGRSKKGFALPLEDHGGKVLEEAWRFALESSESQLRAIFRAAALRELAESLGRRGEGGHSEDSPFRQVHRRCALALLARAIVRHGGVA